MYHLHIRMPTLNSQSFLVTYIHVDWPAIHDCIVFYGNSKLFFGAKFLANMKLWSPTIFGNIEASMSY